MFPGAHEEKLMSFASVFSKREDYLISSHRTEGMHR